MISFGNHHPNIFNYFARTLYRCILYRSWSSAFSGRGLIRVNYFTVLKRKGKEELISMKKIMNTSLIYFVLAMADGVFTVNLLKWNGYTEPTTLGVLARAFTRHGNCTVL